MEQVGHAIRIERITVKADRLVCEIRLASWAPQLVTPRLAQAVRAQFPQIETHACVNEVGNTFGAVLDCASLPHLLEHLAIQFQAEAWAASTTPCSAAPNAFVGVTEWADRRQGTACIQLSFCDDVTALKALRDAVVFVNESL